MQPLSLDLRGRIVSAFLRGEGSARELARRFSVGHATVERLIARFRLTGVISPKQRLNNNLPTIREEDFALIRSWIAAEPDLTQQEMADRFTEETGRPVSQRTMSRTLQRMGVTRKKSP